MARTAQRVVEVDDGAECSDHATVLFTCSASGTLLAVGPALRGLPGQPASALVDPSSVQRLDQVLRAVVDGVPAGATSLRLGCCQEMERSVSWSALTGADPESTQVVFVGTEPPVRRAFRPSLRLQEAIDRLSRDVTVVVDAEGTLLYASPSAAGVLGYGTDGVLPADIWRLVHPDDAGSVRAALRDVADGADARGGTLRVRAAAGNWHWVELAAVGLHDDAIEGVACALQDITAEVEAKQAARAAEARFRALADTSDDGVCIIGLGGETLYANPRLASILGTAMSPACYVDVMCALEAASGRLELPYAHPDGRERTLRVSATPQSAADGSPEGTLVVVSDVTDLRAAEPDRSVAGHDPDALAADLRTALADDALHLEYQPVVDLRTGVVVGMEALARWTHPERGAVPPTEFVAVAERNGLAPRLDRWSVRRALRDMAAFRAAGAVPGDAYVAVNLSACSLADTLAVEDMVAWTEEAGLPPGQLVLEITETAIMENSEAAIRLLRNLRERGVRVAMDDFGTGYSSLAYLRDLPISALKIDRSFVADLTERPDARAIVASVVALARAVGVAVVAEGVETAIQAAVLQRLGCVHAQGWLWSPSVPVADVLAGVPWRAPLRSAAEADGATRSGGVTHGLRRLFELHQDGAPVATIVDLLDAEGYRTPSGRRWHRSSVARVIAERIRRCAGTSDSGPRAGRPAQRP